MKIVRQLATTLALCGAAFFTNMAHAGDCGSWVTSSFLEPWTIYVDGIPVHGQGWVTYSEWVPSVCVTPPEPEPTPNAVSNYSDIVEMASEGEDITSPVDAAKAAARRGVGYDKYFSFCTPGPVCVRWLRTGVNSVVLCQPIGPTSNCR